MTTTTNVGKPRRYQPHRYPMRPRLSRFEPEVYTPLPGDLNNTCVRENWLTIAATPLPMRWVNVFHYSTGPHLETAPALLLQECTTRTYMEIEFEESAEGITVHKSNPRTEPCERMTRSVFATTNSWNCLIPALLDAQYGYTARAEELTQYVIDEAEATNQRLAANVKQILDKEQAS